MSTVSFEIEGVRFTVEATKPDDSSSLRWSQPLPQELLRGAVMEAADELAESFEVLFGSRNLDYNDRATRFSATYDKLRAYRDVTAKLRKCVKEEG